MTQSMHFAKNGDNALLVSKANDVTDKAVTITWKGYYHFGGQRYSFTGSIEFDREKLTELRDWINKQIGDLPLERKKP